MLYMQSTPGNAGVCYAMWQMHCARRLGLLKHLHLSDCANDTVYLSKSGAA